ncbi:velvet factor-domain-containing protein [Colletotrichum navitas]|uniref:Velvet factor-domain-containing protein n=1 Tax=Colletotrichum navitas TaxID=681940 RepID=A0AAD8VCF9_9PEZI|nr:velvet factor-domain-containing protein [Colletotrichum navitas]KAK1600063.1 velvet factor-domain-containing protein [Colletotrichum navitas]
MNYDQHHPAPGGYHHMAPGPYSHLPPPPPPQQHHQAAPQHHQHPSSQMPQLPPMGYPAPAPLPSNSNMPPNGMPLQHHQSAAPSASSGAPGQQAVQNAVPAPMSKTDDIGRKYELVVMQQPQRARMCGFGDKDRRPITPPPCIKVVVRDAKTGQEINPNDIDSTFYVIQVDLWSEDGTSEVNLVRHSSNTASISTTQPFSYSALREEGQAPAQPMQAYSQMMPSYGSAPMGYAQQQPPPPQQHMMPGYGMPSGSSYQRELPDGERKRMQHYGVLTACAAAYQSSNPQFAPPTQYFPQHANPAPVPSQADMAYGAHRQSLSMAASQPQGMFTRNLIGSTASSAFKLNDVEDHVGIWFIMQDLSVRTEGHFRLRFSFVNVARPPDQSSADGSLVNQGTAPILASTFSDVFQVFSAKKFPGVCESTPLSKCFATQGIKIPIRKEGAGDGKKAGEDDDDFQ